MQDWLIRYLNELHQKTGLEPIIDEHSSKVQLKNDKFSFVSAIYGNTRKSINPDIPDKYHFEVWDYDSWYTPILSLNEVVELLEGKKQFCDY